MKKIALSCLCLFIFAGMSFSAEQQKNTFLENFAVGYSQIPVPSDTSGTNNVSSLAGRYWFNKDMGLDITLGFQTGDGDDVCMLGGKFLGKIYTLKNLDIYCLGGIQFGTVSVNNSNLNSSSDTAFRIIGGFGAEYYILPCLSILTEVGLSFETVNSNPSFSRFKTYADWLPQAGIRFYFSKI
ncbi:MAG: hypothetical protein VB017_05080 [Endomicrobiaceae bacterium]|nr:hypothetical protein [Endomicrobiaceae bacterium]